MPSERQIDRNVSPFASRSQISAANACVNFDNLPTVQTSKPLAVTLDSLKHDGTYLPGI